MRILLPTLVAAVALGATPASAAPTTGGLAGYVAAKATDGSFRAECHFARGPKGVTFGGYQDGVAGWTYITCSVSSGGTTLEAYGANSASGAGQLPAGPVTVCVDAGVVRFADSSHASGCATW